MEGQEMVSSRLVTCLNVFLLPWLLFVEAYLLVSNESYSIMYLCVRRYNRGVCRSDW